MRQIALWHSTVSNPSPEGAMEFSLQDRRLRLQSLAGRVFGDAARARDWLREIDHGYFA